MPPTDPFTSNSPGLTSPGASAFAITPHDTNDLTILPRGIYVGGAGDLVVHLKDANGAAASITLAGVQAGSLLPIRPTRVLTASTATSIVGVY